MNRGAVGRAWEGPEPHGQGVVNCGRGQAGQAGKDYSTTYYRNRLGVGNE